MVKHGSNLPLFERKDLDCHLQPKIHANFVLQAKNAADEAIDSKPLHAKCVSYELPHNGRISHDGRLHGGPYKTPELWKMGDGLGACMEMGTCLGNMVKHWKFRNPTFGPLFENFISAKFPTIWYTNGGAKDWRFCTYLELTSYHNRDKVHLPFIIASFCSLLWISGVV